MAFVKVALRSALIWTKRLVKICFVLVAICVAILLIGLYPTNNQYRPAKHGVTIYIVSNGVHADLLLPAQNPIKNWTQVFNSAKFGNRWFDAPYIAIGWGDQDFYLHTETWEQLKYSTAAKALFLPTKCCLHVELTSPDYYPNATAINISEKEYRLLAEYIDSFFKKSRSGEVVQIEGYSYSTRDAFFEATGRYHLLNTCNSWVGNGLRKSGVRTPLLTPLPGMPTLYLQPNQARQLDESN